MPLKRLSLIRFPKIAIVDQFWPHQLLEASPHPSFFRPLPAAWLKCQLGIYQAGAWLSNRKIDGEGGRKRGSQSEREREWKDRQSDRERVRKIGCQTEREWERLGVRQRGKTKERERETKCWQRESKLFTDKNEKRLWFDTCSESSMFSQLLMFTSFYKHGNTHKAKIHRSMHLIENRPGLQQILEFKLVLIEASCPIPLVAPRNSG